MGHYDNQYEAMYAERDAKTAARHARDFGSGARDQQTNQGALALVQALIKGSLDLDEARRLAEFAPRLCACIRDGLGDVSPKVFLEMARDGKLTGSKLYRALA